jgi:hypothetical protein
MRYRRAVHGVLAAALAIAGCADDRGPRLSSVEPAAAPPGAQVVITGERLCGDTGDCATAAGEIDIGLSPPTVRATVIAYEDTTATIAIPTAVAIGPTAIVVIVNERASNALDFDVIAPTAR